MLTLIHRSTGLSIRRLYHHLMPHTLPEAEHMLRSDRQKHESTTSLVLYCLYLNPYISHESIINPLRTVVAYMRQGNKLDYHVQTNRYNFAAHHPTT